MPRYVMRGCCADATHVANRTQPRFEATLVKELKEAGEFLRDCLFTSGYRQIKVLDPAVSWRGKNNECIWGDDPVHPKEAAYAALAEGAITVITSMESRAKKRARTNSETGFSGSGPTLNSYSSRRGGSQAANKRGSFAPRRGN
jgi:hypothetical protein